MSQMGLDKRGFGAPMWIRICAGGLALSLLLPVIILPFRIQDSHGVWVYLWSLPLLFYLGRFMASIALTGIGPEEVLWPFEQETIKALLVIIWFVGSLIIY